MEKNKQIVKEDKISQDNKGKLKPKYRDMPRFKAIFEYEAEFKNNYHKQLKTMVMDISKQLVKQIVKK